MIFDAKNNRWVKEERSKVSFFERFLNWTRPTTDIVFFQKQEKVFVRVPNELKCYENRDFTCLNHRFVLKKQRETRESVHVGRTNHHNTGPVNVLKKVWD